MKKGHSKYNIGLCSPSYEFCKCGNPNRKAKIFEVPDEEAEFIWDVLGPIAMEEDVTGYLDYDESALFAETSKIKKMIEIAEPYKDKCPTFYEALIYTLENDCILYA